MIDNKAQKAQQLENSYPSVHCTPQPLIKTYGSTKKELILLALKVFSNEIKAYVFLSLEEEWQEQWLISTYEEERNSQS